MEARAEFRQPRISKGLIAIVALSVTLGLGVMAGTVAKNLNGSATTVQTHAIVQGKGGAAIQSVRHSGTQTGEANPSVSVTAVGPDDRAGSPALAPIAGRGVSPDAADRRASQLTVATIGSQLVPQGVQTNPAQNRGNAFVAPDAADHKYQTWAAPQPTRSMEDAPGFRDR